MRQNSSYSTPYPTLETFRICVIGASLGGLRALQILCKDLPEDFPLPLAVVLHRQKDFDSYLVEILQRSSELHVKEVEDKMDIEVGNIYIAPPDYHLLIENETFALSTDKRVSLARPAIDPLFESCAESYGASAIGIILTGGGKDGASGLASIQAHGGAVIVEDPLTAESPAMPEAAIAATATDQIYPLTEIADVLMRRTLARYETGRVESL